MASRLLVRLIVPIVGLSVLLLAFGGVSAWYIHRLYLNSSQQLRQYLASAGVASELEHALWYTRWELTQHILTGSEQALRSALGFSALADQRLEQAELLEPTLQGQNRIARVREVLQGFRAQLVIGRALEGSARREEAIRLVREVLPAAIEEADAYRQINEQRLLRVSQQTQLNANRIGIALCLLGLGGAGAGVLGGYGVSRVLQQSIVELSVPVHDAAGKLDEVVGPVRVSASTNHEQLRATLGSLADRVGTVVERLQAAQRESLRAEQLAATGRLAAGLAHELRNPLTAMKTLVQAARQSENQRTLDEQDLAILEEEMERLSETIQTFLDFARPPALQRRMVALADVIEHTLPLVTPRAAQQGIALQREIDPNLPPLEADPEQLRQVLLNLVLNAMDALGEGGTIIVRARRAPDPSETAHEGLLIQVSDDGPGLPDELGERIFEPFISTKEAGTGLGLAICRRIIENHGGNITAQTAREGGAVFTIWLPVANNSSAAVPRVEREG